VQCVDLGLRGRGSCVIGALLIIAEYYWLLEMHFLFPYPAYGYEVNKLATAKCIVMIISGASFNIVNAIASGLKHKSN
jgi:hypothetical protein